MATDSPHRGPTLGDGGDDDANTELEHAIDVVPVGMIVGVRRRGAIPKTVRGFGDGDRREIHYGIDLVPTVSAGHALPTHRWRKRLNAQGRVLERAPPRVR